MPPYNERSLIYVYSNCYPLIENHLPMVLWCVQFTPNQLETWVLPAWCFFLSPCSIPIHNQCPHGNGKLEWKAEIVLKELRQLTVVSAHLLRPYRAIFTAMCTLANKMVSKLVYIYIYILCARSKFLSITKVVKVPELNMFTVSRQFSVSQSDSAVRC